MYELNDYEKHIMALIEYECESENFDGHLNLKVNKNAKTLLELFLMKLINEEIHYMPSSNETSRIFEKSIGYMKKNIYGKITVGEVADYCAVSQTKLKNLFSEFADKGVIEYFSLLKSNEAKRLLKEGKSVGEVSEILNFSSQAYFSLWFKKQVGKPPIKYNKEYNRDIDII